MKKSLIAIFLMVTILATVPSTMAYETEITVKRKTVMLDVSHGAYHTDVEGLKGNLTEAKNDVVMLEGENYLKNFTNEADAMFMSQPADIYNSSEKYAIRDWFKMGGKLLVIGGDSDYGGYYNPYQINNLLGFLGSSIILDSTSISDEVNNDGASYRVAATQFGDGEVAQKLTEGMDAGIILHGPCAVLGINLTAAPTTYYDLRTKQADNVEIIMQYSSDAEADDSDVSELTTDLYAESETTGDYPAVVYEELSGSYLILAGEAFFTDYKYMYDQNTENGEYNNGTHYGQMLTNNIINYFLGELQAPATFIPVVSAIALFATMYVIVRRRK